jgi:hypothetical protein
MPGGKAPVNASAKRKALQSTGKQATRATPSTTRRGLSFVSPNARPVTATRGRGGANPMKRLQFTAKKGQVSTLRCVWFF